MADKIKPLKLENPATGGTENDGFPTEADPSEDYITGKGFAFENNDNRLIDLSGSGHIQFKDAIETSYITVRQLRTALNNIFDGSAAVPAFAATNVNAAIIEARYTAPGTAARYAARLGYSGNAGTNRWLESFSGSPSNTTPFVVAESGAIKSLSLATDGNSTCTITIFKNGASFTTISLSAASSNVVTGLLLTLENGDKLSAQVTSGSGKDPGLNIFIQVAV